MIPGTLSRLICLTLLVTCLHPRASAAELTVAAASNVKFALDEVVTSFHARQSEIRVKVAYGSSGGLFAQIRNRAPFDIFLSADMDYPRRLASEELGIDTNVFLYATGRLVIWARTDSPDDVEALGPESLLAPSVKKIAVANPRHAPYGVAAMEAMKSLGVYDQVEARLVYGENIAQAAQFVQTGNADIGIVALALAVASPMSDTGRHWEIPAHAHSPVEQGGLILKGTKQPEAARAFCDFMLGEAGREILTRHGYFSPEE